MLTSVVRAYRSTVKGPQGLTGLQRAGLPFHFREVMALKNYQKEKDQFLRETNFNLSHLSTFITLLRELELDDFILDWVCFVDGRFFVQ